jgi:hypothetical protein
MTTITRIYYRNSIFHIGYVRTLMDNELYTKKNGGICYVIVDDRFTTQFLDHINQILEYLDLRFLKTVSISEYHQQITDYTLKLISQGKIVVKGSITDPDENFKAELNNKLLQTVAYYKDGNIVYVFEYIIKALDHILGVTDVITSYKHDGSMANNNINYIEADIYHILGFKYNKLLLSKINYQDPYYLTLHGIKNRHIPSLVIKAFYLLSTQLKVIHIKNFFYLLKSYLYKVNIPTTAVFTPVKLTITNWDDRTTEYSCHMTRNIINYYPLSRNIYVSDVDTHKLNDTFTLYKSITCIKSGINEIEYVDYATDNENVINWCSSESDSHPCQVRFVLYNWFYTGFKNQTEPEILEGYIQSSVFNDLDKYYFIDGWGYFCYDHKLSSCYNLPTFIRICK